MPTFLYGQSASQAGKLEDGNGESLPPGGETAVFHRDGRKDFFNSSNLPVIYYLLHCKLQH